MSSDAISCTSRVVYISTMTIVKNRTGKYDSEQSMKILRYYHKQIKNYKNLFYSSLVKLMVTRVLSENHWNHRHVRQDQINRFFISNHNRLNRMEYIWG